MNLRRIYDVIVRRNIDLRGASARRLFASESAESKNDIVDIASADEQPIFPKQMQEEEITRKRNKSRLNQSDRNKLMGLRPYDKPVEWYQNTLKYKRRMLGRYGLQGNDEPAGFAWPTKEELDDAKEYERVAFPFSLQERWKSLEEKRQQMAMAIKKRDEEVLEKLAKMDQWTAELNAKIAKKEADLENARLKKERLIEEIRRHFGFKISPHDERFKEMLAQKELEEKKKKKEAKRKAKMEKLVGMLKENTTGNITNPSQEGTTDSSTSTK